MRTIKYLFLFLAIESNPKVAEAVFGTFFTEWKTSGGNATTLGALIVVKPQNTDEVAVSIHFIPRYCWEAIEIVPHSNSAATFAYNGTYGERLTVKVTFDYSAESCAPNDENTKLPLKDFSFQMQPLPNKTTIFFNGCPQFDLEDSGVTCRSGVIFDGEASTPPPKTTTTQIVTGKQYLIICPDKPRGDLTFDQCTSTSEPSTASSPSSSSTTIGPTTATSIMTSTHSPPSTLLLVGLSALSLAVLIGVIVVIIVLIRYYRRKKRHAETLEVEIFKRSVQAAIGDLASIPYRGAAAKSIDIWEVDRERIVIDAETPLGKGAFGVVYLGHVRGDALLINPGLSPIEKTTRSKDQKVAVKTVPESSDSFAYTGLIEEINLMKSIGYNEKLVNLLGCVTTSAPPYLIMEYCPFGDLKSFLLKSRVYTNVVIEQGSPLDSNGNEGNSAIAITPKLQLCFAVQIATALEYLSGRGFVHRDVAARNVLVDENVSCKLADFGLCRRVGDIDDYYMGKGGRLPLKWMSPEAITDLRFTVESDVWSFGVVLYEIFTLGSSPYPDCPAAEILTRLLAGYRMDKPENCAEAVHELMLDCWAKEAKQRPSFTENRKRLTAILEEVTLDDDYYLQLVAYDNSGSNDVE